MYGDFPYIFSNEYIVLVSVCIQTKINHFLHVWWCGIEPEIEDLNVRTLKNIQQYTKEFELSQHLCGR